MLEIPSLSPARIEPSLAKIALINSLLKTRLSMVFTAIFDDGYIWTRPYVPRPANLGLSRICNLEKHNCSLSVKMGTIKRDNLEILKTHGGLLNCGKTSTLSRWCIGSLVKPCFNKNKLVCCDRSGDSMHVAVDGLAHGWFTHPCVGLVDSRSCWSAAVAFGSCPSVLWWERKGPAVGDIWRLGGVSSASIV